MTVSRIIAAPAEALYRAFLDPVALVAWLPPVGMTGKIHAFDARIGGGYAMSLYYPADDTAHRGKTAAKEDRVEVRFVVLDPPRRVVQAVNFASDDPAFAGEMTMTIAFDAAPGGTKVSLAFANLPRGLDPKDNDEGARLSLENLARRFEG